MKPSTTARRAIDQRQDILDLLKTLTPELIAELDRRARFITRPDGYPAGGGAGRGSDVSRPTERAAVAILEGDSHADPVGDQIRLVLATLAEAAGVLKPMDRWLRHLDAYQDQANTRDSSLAGDCKACERPIAGGEKDPIRNGYCDACRNAYRRWTINNPVADDPAQHRRTFEEWRRTRLASIPEPAATATCSHRCCAHHNRTGHTDNDHWRTPDTCAECHQIADEIAS